MEEFKYPNPNQPFNISKNTESIIKTVISAVASLFNWQETKSIVLTLPILKLHWEFSGNHWLAKMVARWQEMSPTLGSAEWHQRHYNHSVFVRSVALHFRHAHYSMLCLNTERRERNVVQLKTLKQSKGKRQTQDIMKVKWMWIPRAEKSEGTGGCLMDGDEDWYARLISQNGKWITPQVILCDITKQFLLFYTLWNNDIKLWSF